ncbi:MAG: radical SAM protein [Desulfitobacteriaceae bacterium]
MAGKSLAVFAPETRALIERGWEIRKRNFVDKIYFDSPTATQSVTLTGTGCALNCAHCGGRYLEGMLPLTQVPEDTKELPFRSALISGGCTAEGKVPFYAHLERLYRLKAQVRLNFHVGLVDDEEILALKGLADTVSFDFVADDETIREVYGLKRSAEDYRTVYLKLREAGLKVMPHLTLGLKGGEFAGEEKALAVLSELGLDGLTFIVFIPTPHTRYANRQPPLLEEVVQFLAQARIRFPNIPLALGCMRPKGRYRQVLDEAGVALGLNRVVLPTPAARRLAEEKELEIIRGEECCAL